MGRLTDYQRRAIAREIVFGLAPKQIAGIHGLTPQGLSKMLQRDEMKGLIEEEQAYFRARAEGAYIHMYTHLEKSAKNITNIADDLGHKDSFKANQFILESAAPTKKESAVLEPATHIYGDVLVQIAEGVKAVRVSQESAVHDVVPLLQGEAALPAQVGLPNRRALDDSSPPEVHPLDNERARDDTGNQ